MADVHIEVLAEATDEVAEAIARLIPQMTVNKVQPLTKGRLAKIISSGTVVVIARVDGVIAGTGVLGKVDQLVGTKYWLEDIVVDQAYRSQGVARAIVKQLMALVPAELYSVNLSSKASRPEAQAWYQRLGFDLSSNIYRLRRQP